MTWTRLKRWIGKHPVWGVTLLYAFWEVGPYNAVYLICLYLNEEGSPRWEIPGSYWTVFMILDYLVILMIAFGVGLVRGRAGLLGPGVLVSLLFVPLVHLAQGAAHCTAFVSLQKYNIYDPEVITDWRSYLVPTVICAHDAYALIAGWLLAAAVVRHMVRRGKWEHTVPVEPREKP